MRPGSILLALLLGGLLVSGEVALAGVHKPVRSHSRLILGEAASGRVRTLPASSLPKDAIVPSLNSAAKIAPVNEVSRGTDTVYVSTDPNVRWQFYSYP